MEKLVIFYSYDGNTRLIATKIAENIEADLLELKLVKEMKSKGFMKYVWGGRAAVMKATPPIEPLVYNPEEYDLVIMGTPVWASTFAPPFNTLFSNLEMSGKNIALFCCHSGGRGKVFDKMKSKLKNNNIIGEFDIIDPLVSGTQEKVLKAIEWGKSLTIN